MQQYTSISVYFKNKMKDYGNFKNIIFFDGFCGICNRFIDFLISRRTGKHLYFSPLQGDAAKALLPQEYLAQDTIIFKTEKKIYIKSTAALQIIASLGGLWKLVLIFLIVPAFIRNFVYDVIARNRYKWFGKKEACRIPTPAERAQFLD